MLRLALLLLCLMAATARADSPVLCSGGPCGDVFHLETGHQTYLSLKGRLERVAVGNPDILTVSSVFDDGALIIGKQVGRTDVLVWKKGDTAPIGIQVAVTANMSGLADALHGDARFLSVRLDEVAPMPILSGSVADLAAYAALSTMARAYLGRDYADQVAVRENSMVSVDVRFAVLATSTLKRLGFDFTLLANNFQAAVANPAGVASFDFSPRTGLSLTKSLPIPDAFNTFFSLPGANFMTILSALDGLNVATTLAQPTLVVRSGEEAEFISGGEVPIPVPRGNDSVGIQFREFGIGLKLEPTVMSRDRIILKIRPEISSLDFSNAVSIGGTQVPALSRRRAATTLELGSGQSFILAGLMSATASEARDKVPLIGDIPVLGMFFKRVRSARERQELIIVVTPHLVSPIDASGETLPMPGDGLRQWDPGFLGMLAGTERLDAPAPPHGLMP
jgi:pilus assembly protein CpaC